MSAQRRIAQKTLPDLIEDPRTKKQILFNNIIEYFKKANYQWKSTEVNSSGNNLIQALTNTLWAIDGYHDVFSKQGFEIPATFGCFVGYNCPELSKHRKRTQANMNHSVLHSVSSHLYECLQGSYWDRDNWAALKPNVEKLAESVSNYCTYLQKSCKKVMLNHHSPSPVRQISDNLHFQFLPQCHADNSPAVLNDLCNQLKLYIGDYEYIEVERCCPTDSKLKYNYIKVLKSSGLPFPAVLTTYTHGNNLGNLNFVWKVSSNGEAAFSDSQPVIESVKEKIPIFHTREMKKQMFQKFGRLMSNMQPAVMRHIYRSFTGTACIALCISVVHYLSYFRGCLCFFHTSRIRKDQLHSYRILD